MGTSKPHTFRSLADIYVLIAGMLALGITGCDSKKNQDSNSIQQAATSSHQTPDPIAATNEPDLSKIKALTQRLADNFKEDPFIVGRGISWTYDVKKTDSLVNPLIAIIRASTDNNGPTMEFTYAWNKPDWQPSAIGWSARADNWARNVLAKFVKSGLIQSEFIDISSLSVEMKSDIRNFLNK